MHLFEHRLRLAADRNFASGRDLVTTSLIASLWRPDQGSARRGSGDFSASTGGTSGETDVEGKAARPGKWTGADLTSDAGGAPETGLTGGSAADSPLSAAVRAALSGRRPSV